MPPPALDESTRERELFGALGGIDAVYSVDFVRLVHCVERVSDFDSALLRWIDGRRTLRLVIASSTLEERKAADLLRVLVGDGVIRSVAGVPAPVVVPPKPKPAALPKDDESVGTWGDELTVIDIPVLD